MKQIGYKQFITDYVRGITYNKPIYNSDIAGNLASHFNIDLRQAKTLVNVNLPRIADTCDLVRYRKGIYYRSQDTVFGKTKLNSALINRDRYIQRDGIVTGYETGAAFFNRIGLTTQIPKYQKYVTNAFKHRGSRTDKKLQVIIKKPKTKITEENYRYLQILDAIENKDKIPIDVENPEKVMRGYIDSKEILLGKLVEYAGKYYNKTTQLRVVRIIAAG
jgi:hypothetical protein